MDMDCIFCGIVARREPALIVWEDSMALAFLDKYPRSHGHLQLVPKTHYRWIYECPQMPEIFATAQKIIRVIIPLLGADHATIGAYGHEVKHAHVWIVPQYDKAGPVGEKDAYVSHREPGKLQQLLTKKLKEV